VRHRYGPPIVDVWVLVGVAGAVLVAAAAQQLAGFGFALMAMPVLSVLVGPKDAVAISAVASLAGGAVMAYRLRPLIDRPVLLRLVCGALPGLPIGVIGLRRLPEDPLRVAVGVVVLVMVGVLATGVRRRARGPKAEVLAGFASGILGTSIGISGPPVVVVLQAGGQEQHAFRATIVAFFVVSNVVTLPLVLLSGAVDTGRWPAAAAAVPAALVGTLAVERVASRVPPDRFRRLVLALLVVAALVTLASAVV